MSKINQIQQALLEMDGGEFQKLADSYLAEKGIGSVNSIGSVIAANKVKTGTPDTLVTTLEGKYIFAEHTTTKKSKLLGKMKEDLAKCFDETKTGISVDRIERVIFCFTGKLDAAQQEELAEACRRQGVNLDLFGIDALSFDLYSKYPGLASDFLQVHIDTGQIVSPKQFVRLYNDGKLATRLDLGFHFREEEVGNLLDILELEQLVILSGRAGIGKSRLSLEVCRRFNEVYPEYKVFCIFGRNRDLWEDLRTVFSRPGSFLILVDDANRVSRFEYIVDLLQHQSDDQEFKVIATVRDYALMKVQQVALPLGGGSELELQPLKDDQIKELLTEEYGIRNSHYLERIADISGGNPRLAVMAAEVAKDSPLNSIYDVSSLYDIYFSSIRNDLSGEGADLGSEELLRVAAIVSFFKAVDCKNEEMLRAIEEAFGISPAALWEAIEQLHELEILDMHENEVVRVSDQVLGTYLFYLATFKEEVLDFGELVEIFFPRHRQRLIDSINPVLNAFDSNNVINAMSPHVDRIWKALQKADNKGRLINLIDVFWFTKRTDTLLWVRGKIEELEPDAIDISALDFEKSSNAIPTPSILSVLKSFAFAEENEVQIALDLLLSYVIKRPSETDQILRILIDDYGFRPTSYLSGFEVQLAVVDAICKRAKCGGVLFSHVFLAVARAYLNTHFEHTKSKGMEIVFTRFDLRSTPELTSLRGTIWQKLFSLYKVDNLQEDVLNVVKKYSKSPLKVNNSDVVREDAEHLLPFLRSVLDPYSYHHCTIMHDYLNLLNNHDIEAPDDWRDHYRNDTYALAEVLLPEWGDRQGLNLSYEEYEQYKQNKLKHHTEGYTLDDYARFFDQCLVIQDAFKTEHNEYQFQQGVTNVLVLLAERDSELFHQVLKQYLWLGDPLRINGYFIVQRLLQQRGCNEVLSTLREPKYPAKRKWLFHLYEIIQDDAVDEQGLTHLYKLYREAQREDLPHGIDYLLKYLPVDSQVVAKVVATVLEKADKDPNVIHALDLLFNSHTEIAKRLPELFTNNLELLKRAYCVVEGVQQHSDYDGTIFNILLDLDPAFITEYITWKFSNIERGFLSHHDEHRDYTVIWARPDLQDIMNRAVDCVYGYEQHGHTSIEPYLYTYFQPVRGRDANVEVQERQDAYLLHLIDERSANTDFIKFLFGVISHFVPERRKQFIALFIQHNQHLEVFKCLPQEPSIWSWSGSQVPMLQGRIDYWESLLPLMNTVVLLPHKQYIERHIHDLWDNIEREKKNDFIED